MYVLGHIFSEGRLLFSPVSYLKLEHTMRVDVQCWKEYKIKALLLASRAHDPSSHRSVHVSDLVFVFEKRSSCTDRLIMSY